MEFVVVYRNRIENKRKYDKELKENLENQWKKIESAIEPLASWAVILYCFCHFACDLDLFVSDCFPVTDYLNCLLDYSFAVNASLTIFASSELCLFLYHDLSSYLVSINVKT